MIDDLKQVLIILHDSGGARVPGDNVAWLPHMMPAINVALNMGYMSYKEHDGQRYFSLTRAGYDKIGVRPFSTSAYLSSLLKRLVGVGRR
jgi:hypothetical protein